MKASGNLHCLTYKEDQLVTSQGSLPSWVPDFNVSGGNQLICTLPKAYSWSADALAGKAHFQYLPEDTLEVRGWRVGRVQSLHMLSRGVIITPKGGAIDVLEILADRLVQILQYLPEKSHVMLPMNNNVISNAYRRQERSMYTTCVKKGVEFETSTDQSRFEVLWRTLLHDHFGGKHPAPLHCGEDILTMMEYTMYAKMTRALSLSCQKASSNGGRIDWEAARDAVGKEYTNWRKFQGLYPYNAQEIIY